MAKRIVDTGPTYKRIVDIGEHYPPVDPAVVAAALGGELVGKRNKGGSPLSVFLVRQGMFKATQGPGTPAAAEPQLESTAIPIDAMAWNQLQNLAASLTNSKGTPTPGQVAGALLKLALAAPDLEGLRNELQPLAAAAPSSMSE